MPHENQTTFTCLPFEDRLRMAASHIASGRGTNRTFDSYFENDEGDALVVALARRANARPNGKLAANLYRYLCRESVTRCAAEHHKVRTADLPGLAATLRDRASPSRSMVKPTRRCRGACPSSSSRRLRRADAADRGLTASRGPTGASEE